MNDTFNVGENPQYIMTLSKEAISKKATIWVMISRHVEKQEQAGCEVRVQKCRFARASTFWGLISVFRFILICYAGD
jgi:hypothetical protein